MLGAYFTVKEIAENWGINPRTVQTMCNDGRIPTAVKFRRVWALQNVRKNRLIRGLCLDSIEIGEKGKLKMNVDKNITNSTFPPETPV